MHYLNVVVSKAISA